MKKAIRFVLVSAAVFAILAAGAFLFLRARFTPEKIKSMALEFARKNIGREVELGSASLSLGGFALNDLRISEYPDFGKGEFLSVKEIVLAPAILPLFRGEVLIRSLKVDGLKVNIREVKKKVYNFSDLAGGEKKGKKKEDGSFPAVSVSEISVKNSELNFRNLAGYEFNFGKMDFSARELSPDDWFPFSFSAFMSVKTDAFSADIPIEAGGEAVLPGLDPEKGKARIKEGNFRMGGLRGTFSGEARNFLEPESEMDITLGAFSGKDIAKFFPSVPNALKIPEIKIKFPFKMAETYFEVKGASVKTDSVKSEIKGKVVFEPSFRYRFKISAEGKLPKTDISSLLSGSGIPGGLLMPETSFSFGAAVSDTHASVRKADIRAAGSSIGARADIVFGKKISVKGRLSVKKADLAGISRIYPAAGAFSPSGSVKGSVNFSYNGREPRFSGNMAFSGIGAKAAGYVFSGFSGGASFSGDAFRLEKISGRINGSPFRGSLSVSRFAEPRIVCDAYLGKLTLPEIKMKPAGKAAGTSEGKGKNSFPPTAFRGKLVVKKIESPNFSGGDFSASVKLSGITPALDRISGSASFSVKNGSVKNIYKLVKEYKPAKIILYPVILLQKGAKKIKALPDFDEINYSLIKGEYLFSSGRMTLKKSEVYSDVADVSSRGSINLPKETLDVYISTKLKKKSGISMGAPLGMKISGTFENPKIKPDYKTILKQPKVKKAIDKGVKNLLKGLFK